MRKPQQEKIQGMEELKKTELRFSKNEGSAVFCTDAIEVHRSVHRME